MRTVIGRSCVRAAPPRAAASCRRPASSGSRRQGRRNRSNGARGKVATFSRRWVPTLMLLFFVFRPSIWSSMVQNLEQDGDRLYNEPYLSKGISCLCSLVGFNGSRAHYLTYSYFAPGSEKQMQMFVCFVAHCCSASVHAGTRSGSKMKTFDPSNSKHVDTPWQRWQSHATTKRDNHD